MECFALFIPSVTLFTSASYLINSVTVFNFFLNYELMQLQFLHFFAWNKFCIKYSVEGSTTKISRSGYDCTSTASARSPCYFRLQADITVWVFREMSVNAVLTRARFHFCSRLHW